MHFTKKYDVKKTECYVMKQCIYFKEKLLFFKKCCQQQQIFQEVSTNNLYFLKLDAFSPFFPSFYLLDDPSRFQVSENFRSFSSAKIKYF